MGLAIEEMFRIAVVQTSRPRWIDYIYWDPESRRLEAVAELVGGRRVRIKAFETPSDEREFKRQEQTDDLVTVVIRPQDRPNDVRSRVFSDLGRKRKKH